MPIDHLLGPSEAPRAPRRPYNPTKRVTAPDTVLIPLSRVELVQTQGSANPLRTAVRPTTLPSSASPLRSPRPTTSSLPAAPAGLPSRPTATPHSSNATNGKRSHDGASDYNDHSKRTRPNEDVRTVANHYNARPNVDRETRMDSPIIGLKNFNNWTKSVLIAKFGRREGATSSRLKVLDLGCGKGGDLQKWSKAGTDEYIGLDIAAVSIEQARSRWEQIRGARFQAAFFAADCFEAPIEEVLQPVHVDRLFDVVSMQFCMHYAFESEEKARMMLANATRYLRPGGVLIGTIPDCENLLGRLSMIPPEEESLTFGNSVYGIKFDEREWPSQFGHRYTFFLQDAVEEVPEYIVYWEGFVALAAEYGLEVTFHEDFQRIFVEERADADFAKLLQRMRVVDRDGETEMTVDQWEAATLYVGFALTKVQ